MPSFKLPGTTKSGAVAPPSRRGSRSGNPEIEGRWKAMQIMISQAGGGMSKEAESLVEAVYFQLEEKLLDVDNSLKESQSRQHTLENINQMLKVECKKLNPKFDNQLSNTALLNMIQGLFKYVNDEAEKIAVQTGVTKEEIRGEILESSSRASMGIPIQMHLDGDSELMKTKDARIQELQRSLANADQKARALAEAGPRTVTVDNTADKEKLSETQRELLESQRKAQEAERTRKAEQEEWTRKMQSQSEVLQREKEAALGQVEQQVRAQVQAELREKEAELTRLRKAHESQLEAQLETQRVEREMALAELRNTHESRLGHLQDRLAVSDQQRHTVLEKNRILFDKYQDLKGNVRVMTRIRPQLGNADHEMANFPTGTGEDADHICSIGIPIKTARAGEDPYKYSEMERVFEGHETNEDIFGEIGQLVTSAITGKRVCIFAYGQTGSGKTHTMNYPWNEKVRPTGPVDSGIIPRSAELIQQWIEDRADTWTFQVTGTYIEIYGETVYDLLREGNAAPITITNTNEKVGGNSTFAVESQLCDLTDENGQLQDEMLMAMLDQASRNRRTRATKGNASSSRSHSLLTLKIVGEPKNNSTGKAHRTEGVLTLVDLAGSEKFSDTEDKDAREEGIKINSSLTALRRVFTGMADKSGKTVLGFRDSALTKALSPCLGAGNCKVLMFCMISPLIKDVTESKKSLEFAMDAQKVSLSQKTAAPKAAVSSTPPSTSRVGAATGSIHKRIAQFQ